MNIDKYDQIKNIFIKDTSIYGHYKKKVKSGTKLHVSSSQQIKGYKYEQEKQVYKHELDVQVYRHQQDIRVC